MGTESLNMLAKVGTESLKYAAYICGHLKDVAYICEVFGLFGLNEFLKYKLSVISHSIQCLFRVFNCRLKECWLSTLPRGSQQDSVWSIPSSGSRKLLQGQRLESSLSLAFISI